MKSKRTEDSYENYTHPDRYGKLIGYKLVKQDRKRRTAILSLTLSDRHLSVAGRVHGGVISGFFDSACGAAAFTTIGPKDFASTVELKVNYFRPLEKGDELRCVARVVFRGKRLCSILAELFRNKEKDPVALCTCTFYIISK